MHGILERIEEFQTREIPGNVKRKGQGTWDGNLCINFASSFLECERYRGLATHHPRIRCDRGAKWLYPNLGLKATITTEGVWRIRKAEQSPCIEVFKLEESGHGDILSSEFVRWRQQFNEANA